MMFNAASVFIFSVLTLYTFYRYILQQNEFFKQTSITHFIWQTYYLSHTLMVIHSSNRVTNEVHFFMLNHTLRDGYSKLA